MNIKGILVLCLLVLIVNGAAICQEPDVLSLRAAFAQALDDHELDTIISLFAEDGVQDFVVLPVPLLDSEEKLRAFYTDQFTSSPDWHTTDGRVLTDGNMVIVDHAAVGTSTGPSQSLPTTGHPWVFAHLDIYEFEGDKIKRLTSYGDYASVLVQLGLTAVPQAPDLTPSIEVPDPEPTGLSPLEANADNIVRWNSHDAASVTQVYANDLQLFVGPMGATLDRAAMTALNEIYFSAFPDVALETVRAVDLGDGWIVSELVSRATHQGPFMGVPPAGSAVEIRVVWLMRYDSQGVLAEGSFYYDNLTLMTQIAPPIPEIPPAPDYLIQDEIYSPSLEGNLLGDPATRPVLIHLPPSYETSPKRRYPTVYLLHGFDTNHLCFTSSGVNNAMKILAGIDLGADVGIITDQLLAAGKMNELIIVLPHAANSLAGSWYERSALIGDYRDYIAKDLVDYIDGKYRTIPEASARGIAGHSMGGYGALSLAMEYPDVFGAVAALSPGACDMEVDSAIDNYMAKYPLVQGLPVPGYESEDMWNIFLGYFEVNLLYSLAAAWTPNLENPPSYVDLPVQYPGPTVVADVLEQWKERDLVSQVERDGANLLGMPIFVDEGRGPAMLMAEVAGIDRLLAALHAQKLSYSYDAFEGDHLTHFAYQIASGLEFLSNALSQE